MVQYAAGVLFILSFSMLSCPVGTRLTAQELHANDGLNNSAFSADEWISAAGMRRPDFLSHESTGSFCHSHDVHILFEG